ncbi:MAG: hypothetical protein PWP64_1270 [Candidatus Cloacimonadota bacterium]|nr:hypothetical protein [Candidatus Cloacimonadota bacterium]
MKKYIFLFLLLVFLLAASSDLLGQTSDSEEQYTIEQLQEEIRIQKREIREAAKLFLVDELPTIIELDPERANQELQMFSSTLSYLGEKEISYLLGHMYARIGEDDKAITIFDSLLDTELNPDARKMLNLVLYRKLVGILENGDRAAAREFLKHIVFEYYNTGEYFPSYLYLYADVSADDRDYADVLDLIYAYNENREIVLNGLLPLKQNVLNRLSELDLESYYDNPTQAEFNSLNASINQIMADLTAINNEMLGMQGMLFVDTIVESHEYEVTRLNELKQQLADYANAKIRIEEEIRPALKNIEAVKQNVAFYERVLRLFDNHLQQNFQRLMNEKTEKADTYAGDLYLDRIYQTDRTIAIYDELLTTIDELLASGEYPEHTQRLTEERTWVLQQKSEAEVMRQKYVDDLQYAATEDKDAMLEILDEYKAMVKDKEQLAEAVSELENYVQTDVRYIVSEDIRGKIRNDIASNLEDLRFTANRDQAIVRGYGPYLDYIDYISLHLSYRDLMASYQDFLSMQAQLPDEEQQMLKDEFRQKQLALISRIEGFISENPAFSAFEQPDGHVLITTADLYYKLAELQYYAMPTDLMPALISYRRAAELDPNLPERDLALYNIAFISSVRKRSEVDQNKIAYQATATANSIPPANSLYSEVNFRESLDALQEIVNNYPESKMYEESVYRLGLLYFSFAEDSPRVDYYHTLAIEHFDQIIADPESPLYYEALYQRGWVRLNSFDPEELRLAMNDFMELLKASEEGLISDPLLASDYKTDAINNIAYCLIALDGTNFNTQARGVEVVNDFFKDYNNQDVIQQVIDKAAQNKVDMGVSIQAIDFLRLRIENSPLALINPILLDSILVLYYNSGQRLREGENLDEITQDIYQTLISDYNHESEWYAANKDKDISAQMAIVENAYEQRRIRLFNNFASQINKDALLNYEKHMQSYDSFARLFNDDYPAFSAEVDSIRVNCYAALADHTQDINDFLKAIEVIYQYNETYPTNSQFYENEKLAMDYARNVYAWLIETLAESQAGSSAGADEAYDFLKSSADRYILVANNELYKNPERALEALKIKLLLADIQMDRGNSAEAMQLYNEVIAQEELLPDTDKYQTYLKLADLSMKNKQYKDAEDWLRKSLPYAEATDEKANIEQDILVQIQSSFEEASANGDYLTEATERLRLASELDPSRSSEILGQKVAAVQAYVNAQAYQEAIDLLKDIAQTDDSIEAIYTRYKQAHDIAYAPDMMNNPTLAKSIEQEFIDQYPSSNYAFRLRLANINSMAEQNPAAAADAYLALFEEVRESRIDAGEVQGSDLLADAILMYAKSGDLETEYQLRYRFIELYPDHENVIPYMEYMAKGHLDRNEMDEYTALALEIMRRSPDKSDYYKFVADTKLQKIAGEFDTAYLNKDYDAALAARDEYLAVEAAYREEGLSFQNEKVHEIFAAVQQEYDNLQRRLAFLQRYDSRLDALAESDIFTKTPAQQIRVNTLTTWDRNLNGGDRRIPRYQDTITAEVNKVLALVREANESGYFIDNDRRLRAMDLIARLYARGAEVVATQLEQYFRITNDASYYRQEYPGEALDNVIKQFVLQQTQFYLNNEVSWQYEIFRQYHLAGYQNEYTIAARNALAERNLLAEYRTEEYILNDEWQQELEPAGFTLNFTQRQSTQGQILGGAFIPPGNTLRLSRQLYTQLTPDFAYLQIVYPLDIEVKLNGSLVNSSWVPIDSLEAGKPVTTRYSFLIPGELFAAGENKLEIELINDSSNQMEMAANLQLLTSHQRILANIPPVVKNLYTNTNWRIVSTDPETGEESYEAPIEATAWNITWTDIANMEQNAARPIWISELENPVENLVFETDFILDSEFREGMIDLIAPESVTVYLNGTEIGTTIFDYDQEPFAVYKGQVPIPAQYVVMGRNILRFEVSNTSHYRGFLATVTYAQAGKEEIR